MDEAGRLFLKIVPGEAEVVVAESRGDNWF
jgi:hypothetical protein